jgi:uncharacterized repeat protein (TIGR01451 family)
MNISDTDAANYFGSAPGVDVETYIDGLDADLPTGPTLAAGSFASFTYVLTNTGNIAVSNVLLTDSNGTLPVGDDFFPTLTGGDTNSNNQLDLGETWTYSALREVGVGQYQGTGTVTAVDIISQAVNDADQTSYFGSLPDVTIETLVNGEEADLPTGPSLAAGSTATFTYVVTNTGNIALGSVVVTDDNGTPGNTADDFNPAFVHGDTNSNELLDTDEAWTYSATHMVTEGQYTNVGSVSASDVVNQPVSNADAANHLGIAPVENADFNGDTVVDTADYVVWRKFTGTTVPAGTLGDADGDTDVDDGDYAIFVNHFGESTGGGSGSSRSASPATNDRVASQDAAFGAFATTSAGVRAWSSRSATRPRWRTVMATDNDWQALFSAVSKDKVRTEDKAQSGGDPEVLGYCEVIRVEIRPAEPQLPNNQLFGGAKTDIGRLKLW